MTHSYVVVDLETTGNTFNRGDRIIQISAVVIRNKKIIDQFTSFVNPGIPVPPFIEELTGIDDGMVQNAPTFIQIAEKVNLLLKDTIFVAHNVPFDLGFLIGELNAAGYFPTLNRTIDTVELAKIMLPCVQSYKLSELSELLGFLHDHPHQADSDALATAEILLYLIEQAKKLPIVTLEKLTEMAFHLHSDIGQLFHTILSEKLNAIEDLPVDLEVYRGIALRKKSIPEKNTSEPSNAIYPLSRDEKLALLAPKMPGFIARAGQFEMMDTVYEAFTSAKHVVIEAGTGTGKSLGYMLPALYFALLHEEQVVISTYTTHMQDQLMDIELKKLANIVPFSFQASVLKGRSNYINMLKFEQTLKEKDPHYDDMLSKMQILVWLIYTETGDLDELNLTSGGHIYKQRIKHDGWLFQKEKDPWYSHDFYTYSRKLASSSEIIITNHAMLFTDIEIEKKLLPEYQYIVVDEAHHLEKAARNSFSKHLKYQSVKFMLGRLGNLDKNALFAKLEKLLDKHGLVPSVHSFELDMTITNLESEVDDFFSLIGQYFSKQRTKQKRLSKLQFRITDTMRNSEEWTKDGPITVCSERVIASLDLIHTAIEERLSLIRDHVKKMPNIDKAFLEELNGFLQSWIEIGEKIKAFIIQPPNESIIWMEGDLRALPNSIGLYEQPQYLAPLLAERFFNKNKSVVMTSATLTVNQSFDFFIDEMGLKEHDVILKMISSSFNYKNMAKLFIPTDLPSLKGSTQDEEYIEAISNHLIGIAEATEGRMLVLFTSYDMLKKTYDLIIDSDVLDEFIILAQGITPGSRTRLTRSFQQLDKAILFGTSSFWEGIDIPGKDLSCLVIVRLPFSPPDDPVTQAKAELLKKQGKNPFTSLSLPEAVIRFKQGFGRLIRGETDRGVVVVFDRRIDTSSYGDVFISSIPNVAIERASLSEMITTIENWL